MYKPRSPWEIGFLGIVAAQATVVTILEFFMLVQYQRWVNPSAYSTVRSYTIPLNVGLFVFGCWWQLLLTTDALRMRNNIQLFALCIANGCLFGVDIMRYWQTKETNQELRSGTDASGAALVKTAVSYWPVVKPAVKASIAWVGITTCGMSGLAYKLHTDFAWEVYKHVSADLVLRRRYLAYQVFLVLMKLGVYFFIAFLVLYGVINVHYAMPEFAIVMALIPVALLQISLAVYCTRSEIRSGMAVVILLFGAAVAYLISRLVAMVGSGPRAQTLLKDEMMLFASVAWLFVLATLITAIQCMINFNHGLRPIFKRQEGAQKLSDGEDDYSVDVVKMRRFTMD